MYPSQVVIEEQGLRDGLQNESRILPLAQKIQTVERLIQSGLKRIQLTSFVHPDKVPQMAEAEAFCQQVLKKYSTDPDLLFSGLVLNGTGVLRAADAGLQHIAASISASDTHSRKNANVSLDAAMGQLAEMVRLAKSKGMRIRSGIMCAFGCRYEGKIHQAALLDLVRQQLDMGVDELALADTTGMANPRQVGEISQRVLELSGDIPVFLHLHDTEGRALANVLAALQAGISHFDTAFGGMGGCPFIPGATGNMATEDLAAMLEEMEISTGLHLPTLTALSRDMETFFGHQFSGKMHRLYPLQTGQLQGATGTRKTLAPMDNDLPLRGIRVLEFTHAVMGPSAGLILADMGAEVIHVEPPGGDLTRRLKGFGQGYFACFNRNKKSLALDLKTKQGREVIYKLIKKTDIVLENFGTGTMDRLGLGYDCLKKINDQLIYTSLKGFMPGPYEKRAAMDEVVQIMGGLAYMTGPKGHPLRAGASVIDLTGGLFGAMGAITALYDRKRTGQGTLLHSALFESTVFLMGQHMAYAALIDGPVPPMPERQPTWSVYRLFSCSDEQQIFIGIVTDRQWQRFCQTFNQPAWATDPRLETNNGRIAERHWLIPALEAIFATMPGHILITRCEEAGICFAPMAQPEDLADDPHLNQGQCALLPTRFPDGTEAKLPRIPLQIGTYSFTKRNDPPATIGRETWEVLLELGYTNDEIEKLCQKGIAYGEYEV